jgi:hypothetical protein
MHYGVPGVQNVIALFFVLGGTGTDLTKRVSVHVTPNMCFCIRSDLRSHSEF